jgi:hypothetical protein
MNDFRREIRPPITLEDRVVSALRTRGLLAPWRRPRRAALAAAVLAATLAFAAGFGAGGWQARRAANREAGGPRFVLLLHETDRTRASADPEAVVVDEYRRWAQAVRAAGHPLSGEKLEAQAGETLSGFFVLAAPSLDAARAIAASCPHARRGGRIDVREIDPT